MILAIDYGRSHLGLAVSGGELPEPKETIKTPGAGRAMSELTTRVERWGVKKIVIGLSEGRMAQETRRWGEKLGKVLQLPVEFVDETLTSIEAGNLAGRGKYKASRDRHRQGDHARAAALILQRYLDNKNV